MVVKKKSSSFELEPLLEGELVEKSPGVVSFTCRFHELSKILESAEIDTLIMGLKSATKTSTKKTVDNSDIRLLVLSSKLPEVRGGSVGVFKQVKAISATPSLAAASHRDLVCVSIIEGLADPESLFRFFNPPEVRFNTDLPKLRLNTIKTEFKIMSEPFVINEDWGYNPAIEVEVPSGDRFYISPNRSLRDIFEGARKTKAKHRAPTIVGNIYRVWKKSDDQNAGFDGLYIEQFSRLPDTKGRGLSYPRRLANSSFKESRIGGDSEFIDRKAKQSRKSNKTYCNVCHRSIPPYHLVCSSDSNSANLCEIFVN